jgi:hypothetical protein
VDFGHQTPGYLIYIQKKNITIYKGHSISHDSYFLAKNVAMQKIVQKHKACTCRYYSQMGVYVQECTYISCTNIILLVTLFGN